MMNKKNPFKESQRIKKMLLIISDNPKNGISLSTIALHICIKYYSWKHNKTNKTEEKSQKRTDNQRIYIPECKENHCK